jgi:hypothetical protein
VSQQHQHRDAVVGQTHHTHLANVSVNVNVRSAVICCGHATSCGCVICPAAAAAAAAAGLGASLVEEGSRASRETCKAGGAHVQCVRV